MPPHRRPFAVDDAEHDGVALGAVGHQLVVAQHAVLLGAEAFDRDTRRVVEPVGAEFDRDAAQHFERVRQKQQLAFGVDRRALHALGIPGMPDLEAPARRVDVEIAGAPDDVSGRVLAHGKRHRPQTLAHVERARDVIADPVRRRDAGVPEPPELAVGRGVAQRCLMLRFERLERRMLALERHRLDERHAVTLSGPSGP